MAVLNTEYMGLSLKSPIIVGSSGLTNSVEKMVKLANAGVGAIVLKSLFEEQILAEVHSVQASDNSQNTESLDYIESYISNKYVDDYLNLIKDTKNSVDVPVIGSINCITVGEWLKYAEKIQRAGADAIELNVSLLPFDESKSVEENESLYFEVLKKVREILTIPISLKISNYSSSLSKLIKLLSWTGDVQSLVLFNRFYSPDINIKTNEVTVNNIYSSPEEYTLPLRWIALLSKSVECDLCASTGVHNADSVIKMLLAGASAVQMVSAFYINGLDHIRKVNNELLQWMQTNNYELISDFRGKITKNTENHKLFVRSQFMKYYNSFE